MMDAVSVSDYFAAADYPGKVIFTVSIDVYSLQTGVAQSKVILEGIYDGIKEYIEKNKAEIIIKQLEKPLADTIEAEVKKYVEAKCLEILKNLDLDAMAKLASIGAAKHLGANVAK